MRIRRMHTGAGMRAARVHGRRHVRRRVAARLRRSHRARWALLRRVETSGRLRWHSVSALRLRLRQRGVVPLRFRNWEVSYVRGHAVARRRALLLHSVRHRSAHWQRRLTSASVAHLSMRPRNVSRYRVVHVLTVLSVRVGRHTGSVWDGTARSSQSTRLSFRKAEDWLECVRKGRPMEISG